MSKAPLYLAFLLSTLATLPSTSAAVFEITYMCRVKSGPLGAQTPSDEVLVITSNPVEFSDPSYDSIREYYENENLEGLVFTMTRHRGVPALGTNNPYDDIQHLPNSIGSPIEFESTTSLLSSNTLYRTLESGQRVRLELNKYSLAESTYVTFESPNSGRRISTENLQCYPPQLRTLNPELEGSTVPLAESYAEATRAIEAIL